MKSLRLITLFVAMPLALPVQAADGHALYEWGLEWKRVDSQNSRDPGTFSGYVQGFIDLHTDLSDREIGIIKAPFFCPPRNTQTAQMLDAVMRYLEVHPEKRRFTGSSLVASALWEAFPCD